MPCGLCGGTGWKPVDKAVTRCDCWQPPKGAAEPTKTRVLPGFFDQGASDLDLTGMVRHGDPSTSKASAATVAPHRTELHKLVLQALREHGPMTDEDLEGLPQFKDYGPSTIRKRRSELFESKDVLSSGARKNSRNRPMLIWKIAE